MAKKTVAIIGAGVSGLAAIKACLEYGLEPICYEMKSDLGGIWSPVNPKPEDYNAAQAYDDLVTNTCKFQFSFSDFPHPKDTPMSLPRKEALEYLRSYAHNFDLEPYIHFNRKVINIQKADDYGTTGKWTVTTTETGSTGNGQSQIVTVDATMLCCGYFSRSSAPALENRAAFEKDGKTVVHSANFWNADPYRGRRVAVVGCGVSGVDIATLLAAAKTEQVYLIAPHGTWIIPLFYKGRYYEYADMDYKLILESENAENVRGALESVCNWRFNHDALGLAPVGPLFDTTSSLAITNDIDQYIYAGRIKVVRDTVTGYTATGLQLKSGDVLSVDDVILATGYRPHYPFLNEPQLFTENAPHDTSYLYLCPIEQQHPTLFTVVMLYVVQSAPGIAELMARAAAAVISGARELPSKSVMLEWLAKTKNDQISYCGQYPGTVTFHPLRDDLSQLIGCRPDLDEIRRRDPQLADTIHNTFVMPYVYRLLGPHSKWELARDAIIEADAFGKPDDWDLTDLRNFKV